MTRFAFDFSTPLSWPLSLLGVSPWTTHVDVGAGELAVRFGPWSLRTPLSNVESVRITGPYSPLRSVGVHISLHDRGVTFGTNPRRGVCVTFRKPVAAALPTGLLTHPGLTVTVEDAEGLRDLLQGHLDDPAAGTGRTKVSVPRRTRAAVSRSTSSSPPPAGGAPSPDLLPGSSPQTAPTPLPAGAPVPPTRVATPPPRPAKRARRAAEAALPPSDAESVAASNGSPAPSKRSGTKKEAGKKPKRAAAPLPGVLPGAAPLGQGSGRIDASPGIAGGSPSGSSSGSSWSGPPVTEGPRQTNGSPVSDGS